jgi:hypothetical protein
MVTVMSDERWGPKDWSPIRNVKKKTGLPEVPPGRDEMGCARSEPVPGGTCRAGAHDIARHICLETAGLSKDTNFLLELGWLRGVSDAEGWPTTRAPGPEWRPS